MSTTGVPLQCKSRVISEDGQLIAIFRPCGPAVGEDDVLEIVQLVEDCVNQKTSIKVLDDYEMSRLRDFIDECLSDMWRRNSGDGGDGQSV